jgi:hypothetical protein
VKIVSRREGRGEKAGGKKVELIGETGELTIYSVPEAQLQGGQAGRMALLIGVVRQMNDRRGVA